MDYYRRPRLLRDPGPQRDGATTARDGPRVMLVEDTLVREKWIMDIMSEIRMALATGRTP